MASELSAAVERELNLDDLARLDEPRPAKGVVVKRLSDRHHRLAKLIAEGHSLQVAGTICGYVSSRVSILQNDPSFKELVNFYRGQVDAAFLDLQQRLGEMAGTAASLIQDRLEDDPDKFETPELMQLVKLGADRTGHGPSSTTKHDLADGFGARLDAAARRLAIHRDAIDITPTELKDDLA